MVFKRRMRMRMARKAPWSIASGAAALLAGAAVNQALESGWQRKTRRRPPTISGGNKGDGWVRTLAWTAGAAAIVGAASLLAEEGTRVGLSRLTGKKPPA